MKKILTEADSDLLLFPAAICRDKAEGGDGFRYFGSYLSWNYYYNYAIKLGWLDEDGELTEIGKKIGLACNSIGVSRAYFYKNAYLEAVKLVMDEYR